MGKATTIYAINGSAILLPCTFSSCFGFENLYFRWSYNSTDTYKIVSSSCPPLPVCHGRMPSSPGSSPFCAKLRRDNPKNPQFVTLSLRVQAGGLFPW